jgi:hypothetical protein
MGINKTEDKSGVSEGVPDFFMISKKMVNVQVLIS